MKQFNVLNFFMVVVTICMVLMSMLSIKLMLTKSVVTMYPCPTSQHPLIFHGIIPDKGYMS